MTGLNNNGGHPEKIVSAEKKKARRPLPELLKIQDLGGGTDGIGIDGEQHGLDVSVKQKLQTGTSTS